MWLERFMIICMWRMAHNRIQTMDHLKKRRIISYDANTRCVLCNSHEEFSRRLLFECKFSHYIWSRCYEWCEETRAPPADCICHFWKHKGMLTWKEESLIWWAVWVVIVWVIWKHHNDIKFNKFIVDVEAIFDDLCYKVWSWCKPQVKDFDISLYVWHLDLRECLRQLA